MPRPLKSPEMRQRRNVAPSRAVLVTERQEITKRPAMPACPDGRWHTMAKRWWVDIWSSPAISEYLQADMGALFRLLVNVDTFWKTQDMGVAAEIRLSEREFGLTPLSRRRLEWTVVHTSDAVQKVRKQHSKSKKNATQQSDPRDILDE